MLDIVAVSVCLEGGAHQPVSLALGPGSSLPCSRRTAHARTSTTRGPSDVRLFDIIRGRGHLLQGGPGLCSPASFARTATFSTASTLPINKSRWVLVFTTWEPHATLTGLSRWSRLPTTLLACERHFPGASHKAPESALVTPCASVCTHVCMCTRVCVCVCTCVRTCADPEDGAYMHALRPLEYQPIRVRGLRMHVGSLEYHQP